MNKNPELLCSIGCAILLFIFSFGIFNTIILQKEKLAKLHMNIKAALNSGQTM